MVAYAPLDDPKIVVVCYVQNGYAGAYTANAIIRTIRYYLTNHGYSESTAIGSEFSFAG